MRVFHSDRVPSERISLIPYYSHTYMTKWATFIFQLCALKKITSENKESRVYDVMTIVFSDKKLNRGGNGNYVANHKLVASARQRVASH